MAAARETEARMVDFPDDFHEPGCRPTKPCRVCRIDRLLRANLKPRVYGQVVRILKERQRAIEEENRLDRPLSDFIDVIPQYIHDTLIRRDITSVRKLARRKKSEMLMIPNLGQGKVDMLEAFLKSLGFRFGMDV